MPPISSDSIRNRFASYIAQQGIAQTEPVRETILIQSGHYCGRKFQAGGYTLVWFVEEDELKLYGPGGTIRWTSTPAAYMQSDDERSEQRRAA